MHPKTSLIIPAKNEERYIKTCLVSARAQTVPFAEILVIDNGSTDRTDQVARHYGAKVIHEPKKGVIAARNRGYEEAKGDILLRIDADSQLDNHFNETLLNYFERYDPSAPLGLCGRIYYRDFPLVKKLRFMFPGMVTLGRVMWGHYPFSGPSMAITKSAWRLIASSVCSDPKLVHEDVDVAIHLAKAGGRIVYLPQLITYTSARRVRDNPASLVEYNKRLFKMWYNYRWRHS
jgi:glycosyltransferase involved in cell wall biosynthesis